MHARTHTRWGGSGCHERGGGRGAFTPPTATRGLDRAMQAAHECSSLRLLTAPYMRGELERDCSADRAASWVMQGMGCVGDWPLRVAPAIEGGGTRGGAVSGGWATRERGRRPCGRWPAVTRAETGVLGHCNISIGQPESGGGGICVFLFYPLVVSRTARQPCVRGAWEGLKAARQAVAAGCRPPSPMRQRAAKNEAPPAPESVSTAPTRTRAQERSTGLASGGGRLVCVPRAQLVKGLEPPGQEEARQGWRARPDQAKPAVTGSDDPV